MLDEMFSSGKYKLPITLESADVVSGIDAMLTNYLDDLAVYGVDSEIVRRIEAFRRSCIYTLRNYFRGIHSRAYENFSKAIDHLGISDSPLLSATLGDEPLYRARINEGSQAYDDNGMFHVPLNKRGVVTSQRYSFPGLPCLYLAASAYTCWAELGRPSFDTFQVAMLKPRRSDCKIIDLSQVPQQLTLLRNQPWFNYGDYLLYWPLMAICSVRVNSEVDAFKPEYIFPQFFLEYIQQRKSSHVGIRYASMKCELQFAGDWHTYTNYVFPTSSDAMDEEQDSRLSSLFEIIRNRSGKELQIMSSLQRMEWARTAVDSRRSEADGILSSLESRRILTSDGKDFPYSISPFGMIELALRREGFDIEEERIRFTPMTNEEVDSLFR